MLTSQVEDTRTYTHQEDVRLAALHATGILDTPPEPAFDTIARLVARYFHADSVIIGFADETRVWVKSAVGASLQELPRAQSVCELVLARRGPVIIPDLHQHPGLLAYKLRFQGCSSVMVASVPIHSLRREILGNLTIFCRARTEPISAPEMRMLGSAAALITEHLDLHRLRGLHHRRPAANWPDDDEWCPDSELQRALDQEEFVLHYQPEVDLVSRRIIGLEALIRWKHPDRGLLPPMAFIPHAEDCGMILPIGDWGLGEACRQLQRWTREDSHHSSLRVCVNLSARQFLREGLVHQVETLLTRYGTSSCQLGLEMTESSLMPNMHVAAEVLASLRRLGISLMMDDFGTGYSSLSYLHSFPFDVLKIDRSFVGRMCDGDQPLQIVRTIIELARVLDMDVVAEGIETCEQYRLLRQMGCRYGQGFLFAKPLPADEITELLRLPGRILPDPEEAMCAMSMV